MSWTERDLELGQTAMFDVVIDRIVPSLRVADQPTGGTMYQRMIAETVTEEPRLVEAMMRVRSGELDGLDRPRFDALARESAAAVREDPVLAGEVAETFGL